MRQDPDEPVRSPTRCACGGEYEYSRYCGAHVCDECRNRRGLARCYCGWSDSGGGGYRELLDAGEVIEDSEG